MKTSDDHEYSFLIHGLNRGVGDNKVTVCIADVSGGRYISQITNVCDISGKDNGVEFKNQELHWTISEQSMHVNADVENGKYVIELTAEGDSTVFAYNSNALIPLFGKEIQNIQYSFPNLEMRGSLTIDGEKQEITGEGWFDRQWGPLPFGEMLNGNANWLWIAALSPEGMYFIAPADASVIDSSSEPWVSEESGKQWLSHWKVSIPALNADLEVSMTHLGQEIFCATDKLPIPNIEAAVNMNGTFQGKTQWRTWAAKTQCFCGQFVLRCFCILRR